MKGASPEAFAKFEINNSGVTRRKLLHGTTIFFPLAAYESIRYIINGRPLFIMWLIIIFLC